MNSQKLDDGKEQARAAFMATLAAARNNPEGEHIVEELTRLLGGIEGIGGDLDTSRLADALMNKGGTSDEFGNPIVEISEEMGSMSINNPTGTSYSSEDIERWDDMTPEAREERKKQYDKMWEILEEEERESKRKPPKASPENIAKSPDPGTSSSVEPTPPLRSSLTTPSNQDSQSTASRPLKRTKSVKFADGTAPLHETSPVAEKTMDWGDVVPATLRQKNYARSRQTMKPAVVERIPGQAKTSGPSTRAVDSDDEDEASEVATEKEEEGDEEFDPGEDMDLAALQREVALDYFSKREGLRNKAEEHGIPTSFASSQPQSSGNDAWDQEWVPLEASLATQQPKSSESRFKAARSTKPQLSSTMSMPVQAVGSEHFSTQIKEGKVVDGKLVAPADSDEDDAEISEEGKRLIAKLRARKEEVPSPLPTSSQSTAPASETAAKESAKPAAESKGRRSALVGEIKERSAPGPSPPKPSTTTSTTKPQRPSRFMTAQHDTGSATPPSVVGRSSPKLSGTNTPKHQPPTVASAKSSKPANANKPSSSAPTSGTANAPVFPLPEGFEDFMREANVDPTSLSSNVIVSPSFLPPSAATATKIFNPENVMRREVKENAPGKSSDSTETPKRVSRFKAQRI